MKTVVPKSDILLLAAGDSAGSQSNARGHLFEEFIAQLMAVFGYEVPTQSTLNNTSSGIELDVTAVHTLSRQRMIAECKAHNSPLSVKELTAFYGKLQVERYADRGLFGYFIALPRLTKEARELQLKLEALDTGFRVYTSDTLLELLLERGEVHPFAATAAAHANPTGPLSDEALLVTAHGLFYAAHELSPDTRLPARVMVYGSKVGMLVTDEVVALLNDATFYTKGLSCVAANYPASARVAKPPATEDPVIEVAGSSSDFEYQFPAAPKFFVGRQSYLRAGAQLLGSLTSDDRAHVLVFNAQSGWGKSSLALRLLSETRSLGGEGVCIDCRTATLPTFVSTALRHAFLKAQTAGVLTLPADPSFATVTSSLQTLRASSFPGRKPLCIFFDQFENIFQNSALTREFRDLALGVLDIVAPVLIGFSWKTDFVAFTESYPYQLRDDIRSRATVFTLPPFGPSEIGELIARLQRSCGQRIHPYLRERIREYSQGLPWLFKKLGSHIIHEIKEGATQDELLSEVLNIQSLFDNDISGLNVSEREALRAIARRVPLAVLEAVDLAGGDRDIVQSLLNQRLLVSIGEKLDIYWDVFRDYLNQGTVPLLESYILRMTPNSVRKLLIAIRDAGGVTTPDDAAGILKTSVISVLNMARDLRQLGVLAAQEGVLRFSDDIASASDFNTAVMARAASALKRHRVFALLTSLAPPGGRLPMTAFAEALPKAYPAVEAKTHTWGSYSRAFAYWFHFAGLANIDREDIVIGAAPALPMDLLIPGKQRVPKGIAVFPRSPVGPVLKLLGDISVRASISDSSSVRRALADARLLSLVVESNDKSLLLTDVGQALIDASADERSTLVRAAIDRQPAFRSASRLLRDDPAAAPLVIGRELAREMRADWSDSTAQWVGKYIRGWMRAAGVSTELRPRKWVQQTDDLFGGSQSGLSPGPTNPTADDA